VQAHDPGEPASCGTSRFQACDWSGSVVDKLLYWYVHTLVAILNLGNMALEAVRCRMDKTEVIYGNGRWSLECVRYCGTSGGGDAAVLNQWTHERPLAPAFLRRGLELSCGKPRANSGFSAGDSPPNPYFRRGERMTFKKSNRDIGLIQPGTQTKRDLKN